jgi:hypothetical protein
MFHCVDDICLGYATVMKYLEEEIVVMFVTASVLEFRYSAQ